MKSKIFPEVSHINNLKQGNHFGNSIFKIDTLNPVRVLIKNKYEHLSLSRIFSACEKLGIILLSIKNVMKKGFFFRDLSLRVYRKKQVSDLLSILSEVDKESLFCASDLTFLLHNKGKIKIENKVCIGSERGLSMVYTPGVGKVCMSISEKKSLVNKFTIKGNSVAIVTDGTSVLGFGDIGPFAAIPVMEGKAMLMKKFSGIDAFPICIENKNTEEILSTICNISPVFGAINLEDISAPRCFEIENKLKSLLDVPVFHDDQHGTAAAVTAGVINSMRIVNKKPEEIKVVFNGVGAAGTACKDMLLQLGVKNIIGCDRSGILSKDRKGLSREKRNYIKFTNPENISGSLERAISEADIFIGLSTGNSLKVEHIKKMNKNPVILAMANPIPEIMPEIAKPYVSIIATGRSDYPNQINNLLAFPGIFRGALDCSASDINSEMRLAAAYAIANMVEDHELCPNYIIPHVFNKNVAHVVARAVKIAAINSGVARNHPSL